MHVDDALYHSCFVKFFAGTDNRAKNTYYVTDPVTLKVRFWQDDLDTVIKTNNVGQNRKPYYVEEHDTNASGEYYWQGEESGFYNVLEEAFDTEMTSMMNNMLTGMAQLGGSVMNFLEQYFLSTQDYFPAIAYNEQARLVYEAAAVAQAAGTYKNSSVQAITQSCGSQRWSEYQWLKDRVMYISSWCEYGEFAGSSTAAGGLSWRGTNGATYNFVLTPAKWLYPRVGHDSGNYPASANGRVRVAAGQSINYPAITLTSDSLIAIRGIDYLLDIGDMNIGLSSGQGAFTIGGKRLQRIAINEQGTDDNRLLATSIVISNATNIKEFIVRNVSTVSGALDLSKCSRLENIDLRGSQFSIVELPASESLTEVRMPSTLTELKATAQPNLSTLTLEGSNYLTGIEIDQTKATALDTANLLSDIYTARQTGAADLQRVRLAGIDWQEVKADMVMYLISAVICELSGRIALLAAGSDRYLTLAEVCTMIEKFGNIQSQSNTLYVDYPQRSINAFNIAGRKYLTTVGTFDGWTLNIKPTTGNNVAVRNGRPAISWSFTGSNASSAATYASFTDTVKGLLNVKQLSDASLDLRFTIKVDITLTDGSVISETKKVGFYNRIPRVGDFAYNDGSFDDEYDKSKSLAGTVVKREDVLTNGTLTGYKLWVYAKENAHEQSSDSFINTDGEPWGIYPEEAETNGFSSASYGEIADASDAFANAAAVVDTAMANIGSHGMTNAYINSEGNDFRDNTQDDGFKVFGSNVACGDFDTENKNAIVIAHAKNIIADYLDEPLPTTPTELADAMEALQKKMEALGVSNPGRYRQLYYPAAYACYLYQPTVEDGETLNAQYARNKWMLPASGLLARICNFFLRSCNDVTPEKGGVVSASNANESPESEALLPLFANILKRVADAGVAGQPFVMPTASSYWSVSEYNSSNAWGVHFYSGYVPYGNKYNGGVVRPVAAFNWTL